MARCQKSTFHETYLKAFGLPFLNADIINDNSSFASSFRLLAEYRTGVLIREGRGPMPEWARTFIH